MHLFGLVGYPLSHSFSKKFFEEKFEKEKIVDCTFLNFPIDKIEKFPELVQQNPFLRGLSVTIPYKESVMKYLLDTDISAKEAGAVNCIKLPELKGYNTDVFGFKNSLKPLLKSHHTRALILGTGGAAKAIACALKKLGIDFNYVSRSESKGMLYNQLNKDIVSAHTLIVNTTPLGMFPKTDICPDIPYEFLSERHLLFDLTYNPEETLFLKKGKEKGAQIKNGLEMLHLQAEEAWTIWNS